MQQLNINPVLLGPGRLSRTSSSVQPKYKNPLLCFLVGGFVLHIAILVAWTIGELIWVDFLHYNPNRSQSNAAHMMLLSPIYGLLGTLALMELPILTGAIVALAAHQMWGRVPFAVLGVMLPLCVYAMHIQGQFVMKDTLPLNLHQFVWLARSQLPVLIGCWWCSSRRRLAQLEKSEAAN
jgi:hypothetical protein